jgi:hypothetical protein
MDKLPDIIKGIAKPDLFEKFKIQLQKDFEGAGFNGDFANTLPQDYNVILETIGVEVEKINKLAVSKLTGLLYRVDISELQIKKLSSERPDSSMNEIISELILKRELQKIIIKEHFKTK